MTTKTDKQTHMPTPLYSRSQAGITLNRSYVQIEHCAIGQDRPDVVGFVHSAFADHVVRAVNESAQDKATIKALIEAAKDGVLMLKELSDALYVRPEVFKNAPPVKRLFEAIALAEGGK